MGTISTYLGIAAVAGAFAAGVTSAVTYEHVAPWALKHQLDTSAKDLKQCGADKALLTAQRDGWQADYTAQGAQMAKSAQDASTALQAASARCVKNSDQSFASGVATGRSLERAKNASSASSDSSVPVDPTVLRDDDFAQFWGSTASR